MTEISPENGTPIDALESGNVPNTADESRMAEILRDMNASGADVGGQGAPRNEYVAPPPQMPPHSGVPMSSLTGQLPPMVQQQQQQCPDYVLNLHPHCK